METIRYSQTLLYDKPKLVYRENFASLYELQCHDSLQKTSVQIQIEMLHTQDKIGLVEDDIEREFFLIPEEVKKAPPNDFNSLEGLDLKRIKIIYEYNKSKRDVSNVRV